MKRKKIIKLSAREKAMYKEYEEKIEHYRTVVANLDKDNRELRNKLRERLDTSMMDQRIRLANSLGQMIEATSKAVMYIVAKEVL